MALSQRRANAYAVNGGKEGPTNWEDKCARLQEENRQLKKQRNEQDQLITDLNTRFRKLMKDYKSLSGGQGPPSLDTVSSGSHHAPTSGSGANRAVVSKLERERDGLVRQVQDLKRQLRMQAPASGNVPANLGLHPRNTQYRQESIDEYLARQEREAIRSGSGDGCSRSARSNKSVKSTVSSSQQGTTTGRPTSASQILAGGGSSDYETTPPKKSAASRPSSGSPDKTGNNNAYNRLMSQQFDQLNQEVEMLRKQHHRDCDRITELDNNLRSAQRQNEELRRNSQKDTASSGASAPVATAQPAQQLFPPAAVSNNASSASHVDSAELQALRHQVQVLTGQHRAAESELEMVKRERDDLAFKLRLKPTSEDYQGYRSTDADPHTLLTLQQEVTEKSSQMAVLTSRFSRSQEQVEMMKRECDKLVDEIKASHQQLGDSKRKIFELEQSRTSLELKGDRVDELDRLVQAKSTELAHCEEKLMSLSDRLTTCTRETELQVRRSCNERFTELESMRDDADRLRRQKERECLDLQHSLSDANCKVKSLTEEVDAYKADLGKLRTENRELHEKTSFLGAVPQDLTDDVHKAMAMVNLKKKREDEIDVGELWQGIEWSDGWEAGRMREAVSTATYDLKLAEERRTALTAEIDEKKNLLRGISEERDKLLEENIELRRRISGIQTTLTKRILKTQAEAINAAVAGDCAHGTRGCLSVTLSHIACNPAITKTPQGNGDAVFTPTLFFTLDGLEGYELAMGENFYTIDGDVSTVFVFSGLPVTLASMEKLLTSHFTLQLHQSYGTECDVVAAATINGAHLLSDFHGSGVVNLQVPLVGQGESGVAGDSFVGTVTGTVVLSDEFIPFLLERKLVPPTAISAEAMNANLLSLRGITGLRVQIFRATNLKTGAGGALPQPYVFYTVLNLPKGMASFINDTVVYPGGGELVTNNPNFEASGPKEHPVVVDATILTFFHEASISFIVFDAFSHDFESNMGIASVPLRSLLESPSATIQVTEQLHPQGTLEIGVSWVREH